MPLEFTFETDPVEKTIDAMSDCLKKFPDSMDTELYNWQAEDMKRRQPVTQRPDAQTTMTTIWPRGRVFQTGQHHRLPTGRPVGRPVGSRTVFRNRVKITSQQKALSARPILRQDLEDKLIDRMVNLMSTTLVWRVR
jgi:hypothetical protein